MEDRDIAASSNGSSQMSCSINGGQEDMFTILLQQLSQAHNSQIQKLEDRIKTLQKKCCKLSSIANENAGVAQKYHLRSKQLQKENTKLQQQLKEISNQRNGTRKLKDCPNDSNDLKLLVDHTAQKVSPTINKRKNHMDLQIEHHQTTRPNKLSKGRSRKKIQYTEVDTCSIEPLPQERNNLPEVRGVTSYPWTNRVKECPADIDVNTLQDKIIYRGDVSGKPQMTDELMGHSRIKERLDSKSAQVFVPETCFNPSIEIGSPIYIVDGDRYAGGDNSLKKRDVPLLAIPETLAAVVRVQEEFESLEHSNFDPPTCASTPIQAQLSQNVYYDANSSPLSLREDVTKNYRNPPLKNVSSNRLDTENYADSHRARIGVYNGSIFLKDLINNEQDNTQPLSENKRYKKKGRISIPKSESQYPVDFSSTQVPSPTFCGGKDNEDDFDPQISIIKSLGTNNVSCEDTKVKRTPVHETATDLLARHKTPHSVLDTDESCQSEDSLLLLQKPKEMTRASDSEPNQDVPSTRLNWKVFSRKRKFNCDNTLNLEGENKHDINDRINQVSSRTRVNQGQSALNDETYVEMSVEEKENSPPMAPGQTFQMTHCPEKWNVKVNKDFGKPKADGSTSVAEMHLPTNLDSENLEQCEKLKVVGIAKVLKQSKLTPSIFGTTVNRTHNASLVEQYNGVAKVNLDSQRDESIAKAVELSILSSVNNAKSKKDVLEDCPNGFKVPVLPPKIRTPGRVENQRVKDSNKANLGQVNTKDRESKLKERRTTSPQSSFKDDPVSLPVTGMSNPNAGTSRLSRKKKRTAQEAGRSTVREEADKGVHELENVDEVAEDNGDNNSCVDMFGDEDVAEEDIVLMKDEIDERRLSSITSCERNGNQSMGTLQIAEEFDRVPKKTEDPGYKYVDVVRKREERQRLKAFDCKECEAFYKDMKLTDEEKEERMKSCSRHRGHFSPPSTPEHYWSIDFPDTQTCIERGYIKYEDTTNPQPRKRTTKYKQLF